MKRILRVVGYAWVGLVALTVAVGAAGILLTEGVGPLFRTFSPLNLVNWVVIALLLAPGCGLICAGGAKIKRLRCEIG